MRDNIKNIYSFQAPNTQSNLTFDIKLQKDENIYCFIGENGIGKTQLLENMARSLFTCTYEEFERIFRPSLHHLKYSPNTIINDQKILTDNGEFMHNVGQQPFVIKDPIIFIGAKNRGFTKNIDVNKFKLLPDKNIRFQHVVLKTFNYLRNADNNANNSDLAEWFMARLTIDSNFIKKTEDTKKEAITVLKLMDRLNPRLELFTNTPNDEEIPNVKFEEGEFLLNNIPFDKLSTGFLSIIKIFQEIVSAYAGWRPEEKDLSKIQGIVFIDELESHLHVKWQTKIIKILRDFFPNTTFYIATHSPLILSGLHDGEAYELEQNNDKVVTAKQIQDITNYALVDIINEFFNVDINQVKIDNVDMKKQQKAKALLLDMIKK